MEHGTFRALHLIGIVLWLGSQLVVTRLLRAQVKAPEAAGPALAAFARRTQLTFGVTGLVLTVGSGLVMLLRMPQTYMSQPWIHLMLTAALVLIVVEVAIFVLVRRARSGPVRGPLPIVLHAVAGLVLVVVTLVTGWMRYGV